MEENNCCHQEHKTTNSVSQKLKDPVCGMGVDAQTTKAQSDYKGTKYYFRSLTCKTKFDHNPDTYLIPEN
jgi:Cu+-exporting ATPase